MDLKRFSKLSGCGATVAHQLPKLRVAGSNPVARSNFQTASEQNTKGGGNIIATTYTRELNSLGTLETKTD